MFRSEEVWAVWMKLMDRKLSWELRYDQQIASVISKCMAAQIFKKRPCRIFVAWQLRKGQIVKKIVSFWRRIWAITSSKISPELDVCHLWGLTLVHTEVCLDFFLEARPNFCTISYESNSWELITKISGL